MVLLHLKYDSTDSATGVLDAYSSDPAQDSCSKVRENWKGVCGRLWERWPYCEGEAESLEYAHRATRILHTYVHSLSGSVVEPLYSGHHWGMKFYIEGWPYLLLCAKRVHLGLSEVAYIIVYFEVLKIIGSSYGNQYSSLCPQVPLYIIRVYFCRGENFRHSIASDKNSW